MADIRSLLRSERASRRITAPGASYTESGKLFCSFCNAQIKTESLWDNHIRTPQHAQRALHASKSSRNPAQGKKRKADDDATGADGGRKRSKGPAGFVPEGFFDDDEKAGGVHGEDGHADVDVAVDVDLAGPTLPPTGEEEEEEEDASTPSQPQPQPAQPTPAPAPQADDDLFAAFERDIARPAPPSPPPTTATQLARSGATISAAPMSAEEIAAQAREEQSTQRGRRDAEIEAEREDAANALAEELEEMENLEERVRKLREKREALRRGSQSGEVGVALLDAGVRSGAPGAQQMEVIEEDAKEENGDDDDEEEDEEDDDFDEWKFGAA